MLSSDAILVRSLCHRCRNSKSREEASQYQSQALVAISNWLSFCPDDAKDIMKGCDHCYENGLLSHRSGYLESSINNVERR